MSNHLFTENGFITDFVNAENILSDFTALGHVRTVKFSAHLFIAKRMEIKLILFMQNTVNEILLYEKIYPSSEKKTLCAFCSGVV